MFLSPATSYEVESYISQMDNKKSIDPYSISEHLLKIRKAHIAPVLSCLVNESLLCGIFPKKLKFVKLISVSKKGSTQDKDSYRPISVLPSSAKYLPFLSVRTFSTNFSLFLERNTQLIMHFQGNWLFC